MHKERKIGNYNHNIPKPKWLLAPDKEIFWFLTVTLICFCSSIYMWSAFPFQLFDYFVKEVIVRPPLISSNYSGGHARGPFMEGFTDSFHSSRQEVNMIWILIHLCSRRQINACSPHCCVCVCVVIFKMMHCCYCCFWEPNTSWPLMGFANDWISKICSSKNLASYNHVLLLLQNNEIKLFSQKQK